MGCPKDSDEVTITYEIFHIPNGFSPNNDQVNDFFVISGMEPDEEPRLTVYNRWGLQVYEADDYQQDWDGRDQSNNILPPDTYYYVLELKERTYNGFVVIKRQ